MSNQSNEREITVELSPLDQRRMIVSLESCEVFERNGRPIPRPKITRDTVNPDALATLLYSQTIFPPATIFSDFASVGMGGRLMVSEGKYQFSEVPDIIDALPRRPHSDFDAIEQLAAVLEQSGIDFNDCTLLLSEGKDSTGIAIALAELGVRVDCLNFSNADSNTDYVEQLARSLGHRLTVFRYQDMKIPEESLERLGRVFEPTLDQAFLSYLLLPLQDLEGRTLIDGMGNDIYMGHLPTKHQRWATFVSGAVTAILPESLRRKLCDLTAGDAAVAGLPFRSFSECQGLYNGFSARAVEASTGGRIDRHLLDLDHTWRSLGFERGRALSRGRYLDNYSYCGKSVALAEMIGGRVYFPWADPSLAPAYVSLQNSELYEWPSVNKLRLRQAISNRFDYEQPKVGFLSPVPQILTQNSTLVGAKLAASELMGDPLKKQLSKSNLDSPRLLCAILLALWEDS